ncbi:hypothetical protein [Bacillus sp. AK031]
MKLKILRIVNLLVAVTALGASFYHFFIENLELTDFTFLLWGIMFFLFGIEGVIDNDKDKKLAWTNIGAAVILFILLTKELVTSF